jgi:glutamine synthetase
MMRQDLVETKRSARAAVERLRASGVRAVAVTVVDNTGITRVKTVPLARLEPAVTSGIGLTPAFDVFVVDDSITTSSEIGGPDGDLRLIPDIKRLAPLAAQPGWAWAPADKLTQDLEPFESCQRSFCRRMTERARSAGLEVTMSFEIEWVLGHRQGIDFEPLAHGPAYGMNVLVEASDFGRDLLAALEEQGIEVVQFHPEYSPGQLEISVSPDDPVGAADTSVLVRQTIRGVAQRHGLKASFAPAVVAGLVGNGGHVHFSLWEGGRNLFTPGDGRHGLTDRAEAFLAGVLDLLPALTAVGSPSVASYVRLVPSHWAGVFQCWGVENREAAIRFIKGTKGTRDVAANAEVKCFDLSANPYLVAGCLIAAGLAGMNEQMHLPPPVTGDPALKPPEELEELGVGRLPESLGDSLRRLENSEVLREAMGKAMFDAFVAVRHAEMELFADRKPEDIVAETRWRY